MSGPIKFRILAIVVGIKKSRICLFRKKVVQRSIHSYRIGKVIFQESDLPYGAPRGSLGEESSIHQAFLVRGTGIKTGPRRLY